MVEMADVAGAEYSFTKHEHTELRAALDSIHIAAGKIGRSSPAESVEAVRRIRNWLAAVEGPHAAWEDAIVYPEVERVTGTEWSTKLMRFEHYQIERAAHKLDQDIDALRAPLEHDQACEIRAHLLGIEMLLRAHIEREELFLLPLISGI